MIPRPMGRMRQILIIGLVARLCHSSQGQSMSQPSDTGSSHLGIPADLQSLDGFPGSVRDGHPP